MPEKSGFFDTTADDPREYPARDFAEYFGRILSNGVFNGGQYLNVTASGSDANVSLSTGAAWINGYAYSVYDTPLTLPIAPATTQDRIDRIVLRLDTSSQVRRIRATVIPGTPGSNPSPPNLTRSGSVYEISLAQVRVNANSTIVKPGNIKDERLDQTVCGLVNSLVSVDTSQFQKNWDEFIDSVENQGFATPSFVEQKVMTGGFGSTTNNGNNYSVNLNPAPKALVAGLRVIVMINATNTGSSTLNVNGLGAKVIKKSNGNDVVSENLKANGIYTLVYDGKSAFILQGERGDIRVVTGKFAPGETGTISNLPFKPMILVGRAMLNSLRSSGGITVYADGYMMVSNLSESTPLTYYQPLYVNATDTYFYNAYLNFSNCVFGENSVNYKIEKSGFDPSYVTYNLYDYFVFGV